MTRSPASSTFSFSPRVLCVSAVFLSRFTLIACVGQMPDFLRIPVVLIHMSPRWGFKIFVYPMFYKHAAPLGLNDPLPRFLASSFSPPRPLCLCGVFITFHASRFNQNSSYFNNRHSIGPLYNVNRFAVRSPIDFANFRLPVNRYAV